MAAIEAAEADPRRKPAIECLAQAPQLETMMGPEEISIGVAALLILQTHVKFHRKGDGNWTLTVETKPTPTELLKTLATKLIGYFHRKG